MRKNENSKLIEELFRDDGMGELQEWIDAARNEEPDEAQWQQARRNLAERLQVKTKENFLMSAFRNSTSRQYRWAAVAAILLLCAIVGVGLMNRQSGLAFADVMEQIRSVKTLTFTNTVYTPKNPPELQTMTMKTEYMEPGKQRTITPDGNIIVMDSVAMKSMTLIPSQKKGALFDFSKMPQKNQQINFLESLQKFQDQATMVMGQKEIDGKIAMGFFVKPEGAEYTIWADLQTGLPVRMEVKMAMLGDMTVTMTDFVFNPELDESLFKTELPEGYEDLKMPDIDLSQPTENDLIETLRMVSENSKTFPETLTLLDAAKLMDGTIGNGKPTNGDIQEFTAHFMKLQRGVLFAQINANNDWHYDAKDVNLGDKDAICWWKPQDSQTYRVIYGDLSIADVSPENFVKE